MRVLLVNTRHCFGGGDSTYAFNLRDLLVSKGHDVAFFAMQGNNNIPDSNSDLFVSYIDFKELNRTKNVISGGKVLFRSIYSLEAKNKFRQMIERFKPDIIHLQNIHAHITPSVISEAKQNNIPIVWTLHDYKLICPNSHFLIDDTGEICEACGRGAFFNAIVKRCKKKSILASTMAAFEAYAHRLLRITKQVDAFLTPSTFLKNKLIASGIPLDKIIHLPLFLPDTFFNQQLVEDKGYVLFLGRINHIKGIETLVEASRLAINVRVLLAGRIDEMLDGNLFSSLPKNVEYLGMQPREEVQKLIREARAVVVPSICFENQPFSILEAFAFGKPVIASKIGGMKELVKDQVRGLFVMPGDARQLAEAMQWMIDHPFETKEFGNNAYEYAVLNHSADTHYAKLYSIYQNIIQ